MQLERLNLSHRHQETQLEVLLIPEAGEVNHLYQEQLQSSARSLYIDSTMSKMRTCVCEMLNRLAHDMYESPIPSRSAIM